MKFGPIPQRPSSSSARFYKYNSDGSGRDQYVVRGPGGLCNMVESQSVMLGHFWSTLREGSSNIYKMPGQNNSSFTRPMTPKAKLELKKRQEILCKRLS